MLLEFLKKNLKIKIYLSYITGDLWLKHSRLNKVLRELNISIDRAVDFLESKGIEIEKVLILKFLKKFIQLLSDEFQTDASKKVASKEVSEAKQKEKEDLRLQRKKNLRKRLKKKRLLRAVVVAKTAVSGPKQVGKIDLDGDKSSRD